MERKIRKERHYMPFFKQTMGNKSKNNNLQRKNLMLQVLEQSCAL